MTKRPKTTKQIPLTVWERLKLIDIISTGGGSLEQMIQAEELTQRLQLTQEERAELGIQEPFPGSYQWPLSKSSDVVGVAAAFEFSPEELDRIRLGYEIQIVRGTLDQSALSRRLMLEFFSLEKLKAKVLEASKKAERRVQTQEAAA